MRNVNFCESFSDVSKSGSPEVASASVVQCFFRLSKIMQTAPSFSCPEPLGVQ